jgi:hypothetical protein
MLHPKYRQISPNKRLRDYQSNETGNLVVKFFGDLDGWLDGITCYGSDTCQNEMFYEVKYGISVKNHDKYYPNFLCETCVEVAIQNQELPYKEFWF